MAGKARLPKVRTLKEHVAYLRETENLQRGFCAGCERERSHGYFVCAGCDLTDERIHVFQEALKESLWSGVEDAVTELEIAHGSLGELLARFRKVVSDLERSSGAPMPESRRRRG